MRRKRFSINTSDNDDESSLTPLIDVVFVVLILFILIAPMVEVDRITLASAPSREMPETVAPSILSIHVREDNTILINKKPIAGSNLTPILLALYSQNPELTPQLYQDRKAQFGIYQLVKNAVEKAGFAKLDVVLEPAK